MTRDLSKRNRQPEMMDSPDIPATRLIATLDGLSLVNALTFSLRIVWPDVKATVARYPSRPIRVLDVACGSGDVLIRLYRRAKRLQLPVEFAGCDISPVALGHARRSVELDGAAIHFFQHDATRDPIPNGYDMIMCSLFLHHLDEPDAVAFLREAAERAQDRLIVHDLVRSSLSHWFARIGTRLLFLNDICRSDGERSVEGAFTRAEAAALADAAGLTGADVVARLPFRYLIRWVRPRAA